MRSASKRNITNSSGQNNGSKLNNIDTNDVSFVSDSKLLKMSPKKSLSTEQSMASESLLMYVGDNNSRMKSKVPTGTAKNSRPGTGGKKPEETPPVRINFHSYILLNFILSYSNLFWFIFLFSTVSLTLLRSFNPSLSLSPSLLSHFLHLISSPSILLFIIL